MTDTRKPDVRPSISSAELAKRKDAVRFAIANTRIEGGTVSPETLALFESWASGDVGDDELLIETLQRNGPGAP